MRNENDGAMERMQALRHHGHGSTVADSHSDDNVRTAATGGGASADDSKELLGKQLGLWFRVNSSDGKKDRTTLTGRLDSNQYAGTVGVDYRLTD